MDTNSHSSRMKQILSQIIRIFFRQENYLRDLRKKIRGWCWNPAALEIKNPYMDL